MMLTFALFVGGAVVGIGLYSFLVLRGQIYEAARETLRQQIPPRPVDPARLAGMTAQIAIADQFRQCRLQRRVALPVDGGARLGHPP